MYADAWTEISAMISELAYFGAPLWFALAGVYLLVAVPLLAFIGLTVLLFLVIIRDARQEARKTCGGLLILSIVHLVMAVPFLGGNSQHSSPANAFEFFWVVALICAPVFLALAALLPSPHKS
jgi:hypothetical protein